jgi:hypothetical protein
MMMATFVVKRRSVLSDLQYSVFEALKYWSSTMVYGNDDVLRSKSFNHPRQYMYDSNTSILVFGSMNLAGYSSSYGLDSVSDKLQVATYPKSIEARLRVIHLSKLIRSTWLYSS